MRPFRICKHVEDQDGRTNRQIQEQKRALKKLPWKRKSLVLAVFVLLRGRFRERFRRNGKRDFFNTVNLFPSIHSFLPPIYRSFTWFRSTKLCFQQQTFPATCNMTWFKRELRLDASPPVIPRELLSTCHRVAYNRIPKCASRTFRDVFKVLASQHGLTSIYIDTKWNAMAKPNSRVNQRNIKTTEIS